MVEVKRVLLSVACKVNGCILADWPNGRNCEVREPFDAEGHIVLGKQLGGVHPVFCKHSSCPKGKGAGFDAYEKASHDGGNTLTVSVKGQTVRVAQFGTGEKPVGRAVVIASPDPGPLQPKQIVSLNSRGEYLPTGERVCFYDPKKE